LREEGVALPPRGVAEVPAPAAVRPVHDPVPRRAFRPTEIPRRLLITKRGSLIAEGTMRQRPADVGVGRFGFEADGLGERRDGLGVLGALQMSDPTLVGGTGGKRGSHVEYRQNRTTTAAL
jgi:hypothetical protein